MQKNKEGRLILVAAPAGFGKTTLVSSWVKKIGHPVAWVSLDESDNDPVLFWAYVVAGFQTAIPDRDHTILGQTSTSQLPPSKTLLAQLINELVDFDEKVILVLDDYHLISNQQIHEDLTYLIDHIPRSLQVVLITRADPPLPIAKLRGRGQLIEMRATDLRFSLTETTTFLNEMMGLDLAIEDIATLDKRAEGWVVGLQLAAISLQGRQDKSKFVAAFSGGHHFILEYLTEEVINRLFENQRHFLLKTSILNRLCGPLCNAVFGVQNSRDVLAKLQRDNLFITSLDDEQQWYRYNHLFTDLLRNLLRKEFAPEYIEDLHLRASQWHEHNGYYADAIEHAIHAQSFERAAASIENVASGTMNDGRLTTLLRWLDGLPEGMLDANPRLRFYQAWALSLGGKLKIAEKILLDAKSILVRQPDTPENLSLRGELAALLTGIITYSNDPLRIIQAGEEALTYLHEDNLNSRSRVNIAFGTAYAYRDETEAATRSYQFARDLALNAKNLFLAAAASEMLAGMQIYHLGCLHEAERNLQQVLDWGLMEDGTPQAFTGTAYILLAEINLEWNNLNAAADYLEKGFGLLQQGGIGYSLPYAYCAKARLRLAIGDEDGAVEALHAADQASQASPLIHILIHILANQVKVALGLGDIGTAARWASGEQFNLPEYLPTYLHEVQQISLSRVFYAQGDLRTTLEKLDRILPQAETAGRLTHVIEIHWLKALALQELGEEAEALRSLNQALSFAVPEGYRHIFLETGKPGFKLLQSAASQGIYPQFINQLLVALDEPAVKTKPLGQSVFLSPAQQGLVEPLTHREGEILKLIANGYTNKQIADELVITINTVKKHTTHIYGKLLVQNRTEAVARARSLSLL